MKFAHDVDESGTCTFESVDADSSEVVPRSGSPFSNVVSYDKRPGLLHYLYLSRGASYDRYGQSEGSIRRHCLQQVVQTAASTHEGESPRKKRGGIVLNDLHSVGSCAPPENVRFEAPKCSAAGEQDLAFSSSFESGNLALALCEKPSRYTLLLDFDHNTRGYTQWFYFAVQGGVKGSTVTFNLVNMSKSDSMFARGMKPVVWSKQAARGWERGGEDVQYFPTSRSLNNTRSQYYTLSFSYTFEHNDDTVFFAYHYPYTYSHLQKFLSCFSALPEVARVLCESSLCKTIGGVKCNLLEITEPADEGEDAETVAQRPFAVVTARVHPGESNSSWMMQGFLRFLCSDAPDAILLRKAYTWLVVPMLNPDGVIHGSYRCNLAGVDLNRAFLNPDRHIHPTVYRLKEKLQGQRVDLYLDFHGHSKKEGVFFYGCKFDASDRRNALLRLAPRLCALASDDFADKKNRYGMQRSKLSTARIVAFQQMGIANSYTVEASFWRGAEEVESSATPLSEQMAALPRDAAPLWMPALSARPGPRKQADWSRYGGAPWSARGPAPARAFQQPETRDFHPARLEQVGPTIGRAVAATLRARREPGCDAFAQSGHHSRQSENGLYDGSEAAAWPHLRYDQLTDARVREELLHLEGRCGGASESEEESDGSDSNPSEDEVSDKCLRKFRKRIMSRTKKNAVQPAVQVPLLSPTPSQAWVPIWGSSQNIAAKRRESQRGSMA
eukprot:TRINITY_DN22528_c0_g1_i1.p1 TRINITY_DN22528_c0_g1~~TRINITY_DN22528_c0_g1_i1.p1  ORF type:complete len:740 (-),score=88.27 TRINITY_DN22528_c0_g1_i1:40-2217(-)